MIIKEKQEQFASEMNKHGILYRIVQITRLQELADQINNTLEKDISDSDFAEYVAYAYNFQLLDKFPEMKSVIVASQYNPCHRVNFRYRGKNHEVLLPPGYVKFRSKQVNLQRTIGETLAPLGYKCERIIVSVKLLAARTGLAKYGRNNISYVEGFGSHHFLGSFITDLPYEQDYWQEAELMQECTNCRSCIANCPTEAISDDRILIHGEKCLTYFNRNPGVFPDWIKPEWHNCWLGCIKCQDICPANSQFVNDTESLPGFDETETEILLNTNEFNELPDSLKVRFEQFGFPELHGHILRNLHALQLRTS